MTTPYRPTLIIIAGPNGSGKTSVTSKLLKHEWTEDAIYINPDIIAQELFGDWNSKESVLKAVKYSKTLREKCLKEHKSLIFETVLSATDKIDYIKRAKQEGFFVRLFFVGTENPTINAARVAKRVMQGGHSVPIDKIISRYYKSISNCVAVASFVDRTYVYDNSIDDQQARILFRMKDGKLFKRYGDDLPLWTKKAFDLD